MGVSWSRPNADEEQKKIALPQRHRLHTATILRSSIISPSDRRHQRHNPYLRNGRTSRRDHLTTNNAPDPPQRFRSVVITVIDKVACVAKNRDRRLTVETLGSMLRTIARRHSRIFLTISHKGNKTRERILEHAFRLFGTTSYEKVTFSTLEQASGISRGSITHFFKNKEALFNGVLEHYVFNRYSVRNIPDYIRESLYTFYNYFIEQCQREKERMMALQISNINKALFYIEISAGINLPGFTEQAHAWYLNEMEIWKEILNHAISKGEIRDDIDIDATAFLFENVYLGTSYAGITVSFGYDIDALKKAFNEIYVLIKVC